MWLLPNACESFLNSKIDYFIVKRGISGGYDWIETEFYETVKMSTYLLAVLVSDFECKVGLANTPLSGGVNISVCARPTARDQLNLALNSSITAIEFFEEFYQIEYPLPKLGSNLILTLLVSNYF